MPTSVCMNCSRVEYGYSEADRLLVKDLQQFFKDELWKVYPMLQLIKRHK